MAGGQDGARPQAQGSAASHELGDGRGGPQVWRLRAAAAATSSAPALAAEQHGAAEVVAGEDEADEEDDWGIEGGLARRRGGGGQVLAWRIVEAMPARCWAG